MHAARGGGDNHPSKPVRIIVPYQAGQGNDVAARYLSDYLAREVGQPFHC